MRLHFVGAQLPPIHTHRPDASPRYKAVADALQDSPGLWGVWPYKEDYTVSRLNSLRDRIRQGRIPEFPQGKFDASVRKNPHGELVLYVRAVNPLSDFANNGG